MIGSDPRLAESFATNADEALAATGQLNPETSRCDLKEAKVHVPPLRWRPMDQESWANLDKTRAKEAEIEHVGQLLRSLEEERKLMRREGEIWHLAWWRTRQKDMRRVCQKLRRLRKERWPPHEERRRLEKEQERL